MSWHEANQRYLAASLDELRLALERHTARAEGDDERGGADDELAWAPHPDGPPALVRIGEAFELTRFERSVLLLCAAIELDARFPALCARAQGNPHQPWPTFSLALAALPSPSWEALTARSALRRYDLVRVEPGPSLTLARLRTDERIWQYLLGLDAPDFKLQRFLAPARPQPPLAPSQAQLAKLVASVSESSAIEAQPPVVRLCGSDGGAQRAVARVAAELLGLETTAFAAENLPTGPDELEELVRVWERDAILGARALLIDCHEIENGDAPRVQAVTRLVNAARGVTFVCTRDLSPTGTRQVVSFDVAPPLAAEQRALWLELLAPLGDEKWLVQTADTLVGQFNLDLGRIRTAAAEGAGRIAAAPEAEHEAEHHNERGHGHGHGHQTHKPEHAPSERMHAIWDACRSQARPRFEGLAHRVDTGATLEHLVLPAQPLRQLREIERQVRRRSIVAETWGFARRGARGLGTTILFSGPSGTGKTLAAEVVASRLRLDLYRIDLSAVVSKYIGETEKNLRRIFDAAEQGGSALLFDEADALFGRRGEVKDSHDRYANMEVSYLLQRLENFRGLAILTTNMRSAIDQAFLRRIRFVVEIPFPDEKQRAEIWKKIFPAETPTSELDYQRLAGLTASGGSIRNIALHAAYLAADRLAEGEGEGAVRMPDLKAGARAEAEKQSQPLPIRETEGWE